MTLVRFVLFILLEIIIVTLIVKKEIYTDIVKMVARTIPYIITIFILFSPLFLFICLVIICNEICTEYTGVVVSQIAKKYNVLNDLKEFGLKCIIYSPQVIFVFYFAYQVVFCMDNKKDEGRSDKNIQISLSRMKMSIVANNVTVLCILVFIVFSGMGIFNTRFINYIRDYNFSGIDIYSEDTICVGLIILLGMFYYFGIFLISDNFVGEVIDYNNKTGNAELKEWKYKLLTYFPFLNIYVIYLLNREDPAN